MTLLIKLYSITSDSLYIYPAKNSRTNWSHKDLKNKDENEFLQELESLGIRSQEEYIE